MPFKTPLCGFYDELMERKHRFHPEDVFNATLDGAETGANIGLWLDLTKTGRYYNREEVYSF